MPMKQNTFFPSFYHYSIYLIAAIVFAYNIDISFTDDGLRHIAFAANENIMKSWGDVFPHSLFGTYDPWHVWDKFLQFLLTFVEYSQVHIVVNTVMLFLLMILLDKYITKYINFKFNSLIYIFVFLIVYVISYRYMLLRPDMLSGLFVFSALLLSNRVLPVLLLTILYGPFYYVFFIYSGSVALVYLIQQKFKAFIGIFLGSVIALIIHLLIDFTGYLETIYYVFMDQSLREGLSVTEGYPIIGFLKNINYTILLPVFLLSIISLLYYKYDYFKNNALASFLLITSILWINQYRFFHLFTPFITIFVFSIIFSLDKKILFYNIRKYLIIIKRSVLYSAKRKVFYLIVIPYAIFTLSILFGNLSSNHKLNSGSFLNNPYYHNKTILMNKLDVLQYKGLYFNPTIKFIPSCGVGWFELENNRMKDIYIRMQKKEGITEEELKDLIEYVDADIYIHHFNNPQQILNFDKLRKYNIIPKQIQLNLVIFEIQK